MVGLEPTTSRLTAARSTTELHRKNFNACEFKLMEVRQGLACECYLGVLVYQNSTLKMRVWCLGPLLTQVDVREHY